MMTIVRSLVLGVAVCAFAACEKQPYSKIKSIEETIFHHNDAGHGDKDSHGSADSHGKKEENAAPEATPQEATQ